MHKNTELLWCENPAFVVTQRTELTTVPAENILSCDDFRTFWVMWETDAILAGHGQYPNG